MYFCTELGEYDVCIVGEDVDLEKLIFNVFKTQSAARKAVKNWKKDERVHRRVVRICIIVSPSDTHYMVNYVYAEDVMLKYSTSVVHEHTIKEYFRTHPLKHYVDKNKKKKKKRVHETDDNNQGTDSKCAKV
jgi:hypothetical protein